ncbi:SH2 domain-containing protein 5-like isoform 3-T5 [Salvelinus alpinus]|uniref:SH2 domain-containing protein 5 isoform X3 n=1 Tax=Salvelinus sp. IW2-2015 TaxID=2691554 RepID=UPI000CDF6AAD|nr:SH2 domain-containing protein 5 isoform X3 [Salvelinus alpinus]
MGETPVRDDGTVTRSAEYVGSFPVDDCCLDDQMQQLHTQLKSLKTCKKRRSVSLKFSIKGVKMYDEDETAQFLNLLLCRCFQLSYLEKHPEEAQVESAGPLPNCTPSLLNQGFPLSVSALVSFRRAPTQGLLPGEKVFPLKNNSATTEEQPSIQENVITSPSLVRKKVIRNKVLRSGAYRSFTYTPHKQRHLQDWFNSPQGKGQDKMPVRRARAPSLAETEEALAQAVWCWAGITTDSSSSLLEEDVLGSYLLCPHPKRPGCGSLIIRFSSGLITHLIDNTHKGTYLLENCQQEFCTIAALIEHYTEFKEELDFPLSCARVNHCYEWEENVGKAHQSLKRKNAEYNQRKQWV